MLSSSSVPNVTCRVLRGPFNLWRMALFRGDGRCFLAFLVSGSWPSFSNEAAVDVLLVIGAISAISR